MKFMVCRVLLKEHKIYGGATSTIFKNGLLKRLMGLLRQNAQPMVGLMDDFTLLFLICVTFRV